MFAFRIKNKKITYSLALAFLLVLVSVLSPQLRTPVLETLKHPLSLLASLKREVNGIIFYHRNYIRNEQFRREVDLLRQKLNASSDIYAENERLRELLRLKQSSPYKVIAARVIGRSPDNWSSSIIIDKGFYHGIRRGMAAVTYLGLAGRVIETTHSTSNILLINDPNIGVSGLIKRSRQEGLVSGTLGNLLIMKYLPKDCDIQVSDEVFTSGLTSTYPKGLLIGKVVEVKKEFSGLTSFGIIKPAVDLSGIEEALIIVQ